MELSKSIRSALADDSLGAGGSGRILRGDTYKIQRRNGYLLDSSAGVYYSGSRGGSGAGGTLA